jgi:hypothetical protein
VYPVDGHEMKCEQCGGPIEQAARGRRRLTCPDKGACRKAKSRSRKRAAIVEKPILRVIGIERDRIAQLALEIEEREAKKRAGMDMHPLPDTTLLFPFVEFQEVPRARIEVSARSPLTQDRIDDATIGVIAKYEGPQLVFLWGQNHKVVTETLAANLAGMKG